MSAGVTLCPGPSLELQNPNYVGNIAPLIATPFLKLPVGAVRPKGWLLECLRRQRDGLCGHLGEISHWLVKEDNAWLSPDGTGKNGWEEVPYWLKGYANLGYILNDPKVIDEAMIWIEGVLNSQREDGNFGPTMVDEKGAEDFWPKMIMLSCLQSYYEYSSDERVLLFMNRFFQYQMSYPDNTFLKQYWQSFRTGDNLNSVLWLYNLTGDKWLLDLAHKIHRCGQNWSPVRLPPEDWFKGLPNWHNVNIAQGFREPATYWQLSHIAEDRQGSYDAFFYVRHFFGHVPGGMFGGDENSRPGYSDPRQGIETCGLVEQMASDHQMIRMTGDIFWADNAEDIAFNMYPAALMPDFRSLRYFTSPNMVLNDDQNHHPGIDNQGPFLMMNPFSSRCCQHNHSFGWPYYVENLWQATADCGLAAILHCASTVTALVGDGKTVTIESETKYPFEDEITYTVSLDESCPFPLYFRVPSWSRGGPQVWINGEEATWPEPTGRFVRIEREWSSGDQVKLKIPMHLFIRGWDGNKDSVSVQYGPLTFSLAIEEEYIRKVATESVQHDSGFQEGVDTDAWPAYEIHARSPWNYGLELGQLMIHRRVWPENDYPFTVEDVPIVVQGTGRRIPEWTIDEHGLCGVLPQSPVESNEESELITLIPMGAARLRISAFPVIASSD